MMVIKMYLYENKVYINDILASLMLICLSCKDEDDSLARSGLIECIQKRKLLSLSRWKEMRKVV